MHQQIEDEGVCRQRVERDHGEFARVEAEDAELEHDETAEQCNVAAIVHAIDDVHQNGNRGQDLEAGQAGILEAKVEPRANRRIQTQVERKKRQRNFQRGRCRKHAERPAHRHQPHTQSIGERGEAEAPQAQGLLRIERGRNQKSGKVHFPDKCRAYGRMLTRRMEGQGIVLRRSGPEAVC